MYATRVLFFLFSFFLFCNCISWPPGWYNVINSTSSNDIYFNGPTCRTYNNNYFNNIVGGFSTFGNYYYYDTSNYLNVAQYSVDHFGICEAYYSRVCQLPFDMSWNPVIVPYNTATVVMKYRSSVYLLSLTNCQTTLILNNLRYSYQKAFAMDPVTNLFAVLDSTSKQNVVLFDGSVVPPKSYGLFTIPPLRSTYLDTQRLAWLPDIKKFAFLQAESHDTPFQVVGGVQVVLLDPITGQTSVAYSRDGSPSSTFNVNCDLKVIVRNGAVRLTCSYRSDSLPTCLDFKTSLSQWNLSLSSCSSFVFYTSAGFD